MLFLISYAIEQLAGELVIAESITAKDSNYVNIFSLDFIFLFITILIRLLIARGNISNANILSLIAFIISYCLFADKLVYALNRVIVVLIIILRLTPSTLLARFISITKICNPLLKKNVAKSRILLAYKYYNFNIYVSLATDILHLLLKGLLIAIVSLLFILKAPFALHFICAVCDLVILAALDSIYTRANSEAYYITIPYLTKLLLSKVAANIAISNFIYAVAQFSSKRHNNSKYCDEEVIRCLYLILIIINYTCYDKDRKHIAYIRAFSKVLLFNNNRQINNTTRMLTFKFYDLSTIICLVHLVLRDLLNLITYTTISYYVNNYIN
ncbi:hypothetical protein HBI06_196120 [Parastagonospora nodorum]|nr:hypothetical protein HBI06_196120 [Parastagonospora nodorum]KAH4224536.1 hypothetical protein HBI05_232740 [Parastagonospora nodorum]